MRLLALVLLPLALSGPAADPGYAGFAMKLPAPMREQLRDGFWRPGCPVPLSDLRLLTVRHYGWDGEVTTGQLVVNTTATPSATIARAASTTIGLALPIPVPAKTIPRAPAPTAAFIKTSSAPGYISS